DSKPDKILQGTIRFKESGATVRNASITIAELKRTAVSDENGKYEFRQIPAGRYSLIIHLDRVSDLAKTIEVTGVQSTFDFELTINNISEQVTVTASGSLELTTNSYQSVTTVGA